MRALSGAKEQRAPQLRLIDDKVSETQEGVRTRRALGAHTCKILLGLLLICASLSTALVATSAAMIGERGDIWESRLMEAHCTY